MDKDAFPRVLDLENPFDFFIAQTFQMLTEGELRDLHTAWQAAMKRAAEVLRNMPDRERMDGKWNPDPNGTLMEHCPFSCAQAIERLGDK